MQVGAGGLFSSLNEVFVRGAPISDNSGDPSFRPYFSGLVGASFSSKWNIRTRVVGTSRAERNISDLVPGNGAYTTSAYYVDVGAELQWKPVSVFGISAGPYYSFDMYERINTSGGSIKPLVEQYDNFVAIRPAVEVFFGPLAARLDASFGLTPAQRLNKTDRNGQPYGEVSRYWNGASLGLSYRLIKA